MVFLVFVVNWSFCRFIWQFDAFQPILASAAVIDKLAIPALWIK